MVGHHSRISSFNPRTDCSEIIYRLLTFKGQTVSFCVFGAAREAARNPDRLHSFGCVLFYVFVYDEADH